MPRAAKPEPDTSPEPNTYEPPTIEIAGRTYTMRRLGLGDVFTVSRILGRGAATLSGTGAATTADILQVIVLALTTNEEPVLKLMASVIGVERSDLDDPERFPMASIIEVGEALAEHQDLADFLSALGRIAERTPEIQTRSGGSSTS